MLAIAFLHPSSFGQVWCGFVPEFVGTGDGWVGGCVGRIFELGYKKEASESVK